MGAETDFFPLPGEGGLGFHNGPLSGMPADICRETVPIVPWAARGPHGAACRPIKAVLFDVEDVLYDASAWYRWLGQIIARTEERSVEAEFARRWHLEFQPAVHRGDRTFFMAFAECLSGLGLSMAHVEEIIAAGRAQRRCQEATLRTLPGARPTVAQLQAAGVAVGILTNTDRTAAELALDLARLGLQDSFACLLTSLDMRRCLPESDCYQMALAALDCSPAEAIFVGHQARDVEGAQEAGLPAIAFNVRRAVRGAAHVDRLEDVLKYVPACVAAGAAEPQVV